MSFIMDDLEDQCRHIVGNMNKYCTDTSPTKFIKREMSLHLDHMDIIRKRQKDLKAKAMEKELYIDSQIMNINERTDLVPHWADRMQLTNECRQMLNNLESSTQRISDENETAMQQIRTRLLQLWNMHDQLSLHYGNTKTFT